MSQVFSCQTEGLILHRYPFNQTIFVKYLTAEQGLIPCVVKRGGSLQIWRSSSLQTFSYITAEVSGRGDVKTLRSIEVIDCFVPEAHHAMAAAFYLNELVLCFVKQDQLYPDLLPMLKYSLVQLETLPVMPVLRNFELFLMELIGYRLSWTHDCSGMPIDPEEKYLCLPGALPQRTVTVESQDYLKQRLIQGRYLLNIQQRDWADPECLRQAKHLLRQWIDYYAEGKSFKSRSLLHLC